MTNKKKKILYLVEAMGGGVVTYIETLANGLIDDFDFTIAYGKRDQTPEDLEDHFDKRVRLFEIKHFTRPVNPIKDFLARKEIKKLIKEDRCIYTNQSRNGKNNQCYYDNRSNCIEP